MAKVYSVNCYHSINNPVALAAYAKIAGPAIQAAGGRFLARGNPAKVYEQGIYQRTVIIEWDSVKQAMDAYDSLWPGVGFGKRKLIEPIIIELNRKTWEKALETYMNLRAFNNIVAEIIRLYCTRGGFVEDGYIPA